VRSTWWSCAKARRARRAAQGCEATELLAKLPDGAALIALDERGKAITTPDFSSKLETFKDAGRPVALIIGGPDGLDEQCPPARRSCHQLRRHDHAASIVRVLAAEQIYRAMTVLSGHPYHRV
jgi:23S rRNA (pseudouridine1915-N3)-methyltransferase